MIQLLFVIAQCVWLRSVCAVPYALCTLQFGERASVRGRDRMKVCVCVCVYARINGCAMCTFMVSGWHAIGDAQNIMFSIIHSPYSFTLWNTNRANSHTHTHAAVGWLVGKGWFGENDFRKNGLLCA